MKIGGRMQTEGVLEQGGEENIWPKREGGTRRVKTT